MLVTLLALVGNQFRFLKLPCNKGFVDESCVLSIQVAKFGKHLLLVFYFLRSLNRVQGPILCVFSIFYILILNVVRGNAYHAGYAFPLLFFFFFFVFDQLLSFYFLTSI